MESVVLIDSIVYIYVMCLIKSNKGLNHVEISMSLIRLRVQRVHSLLKLDLR